MRERDKDQRDALNRTPEEQGEHDAYWRGFDDGKEGRNHSIPFLIERETNAYFMGYADGQADHVKEEERQRGALTGDIHQTDAWFTDNRSPEERFGGR